MEDQFSEAAKIPEFKRSDHILPRGYLEGFTDPSKKGRLYAFNIAQRRWFETRPGSIGAATGFYDYALNGNPDATADEVFSEFETHFPAMRRELVDTNFSAWTKHEDFLVRYSQMPRARSALFREQFLKDLQSATLLTMGDLVQTKPSENRPGETDFEYGYSDFNSKTDAHRDALFKNMSITKMRAEIGKGAGEFTGWHWCLRFTTDVTNPVVTADVAIALISSGPFSLGEAMKHPESPCVFPLCWQACLIGSPCKFDVETDVIHPAQLAAFQRLYLHENDCRFAYSPQPLS